MTKKTEQFIEYLLVMIEYISSLLRDFQPGNIQVEQDIKKLAHSLHESGTTHGFAGISDASKELAQASTDKLIKKMAVLLVALKSVTTQITAGTNDQITILIVEDDEPIANQLVANLRLKSGLYKTIWVKTAAKAYEYLDKQEFSLLVLDLVLPDGDGRDVLRKIKFNSKKKLSVFVMSVMTEDVIRVECMSLGAQKFFTKPFDSYKLVDQIDNFLQNKNRHRKLSLIPHVEDAIVDFNHDSTAPKTDFSAFTILVVSDDVKHATSITKRLLLNGFLVEHATNTMEAIAVLSLKYISLIILDIQISVLDGFGVLKQLRNDPNREHVPIIMLNIKGAEKDFIKGYDLGVDDYILKPYSMTQLIARVKIFLK